MAGGDTELAALLLECRQSKGITQKLLADMCQMPRQAIIDCEKGRHRLTPSECERIVAYLRRRGVSPDLITQLQDAAVRLPLARNAPNDAHLLVVDDLFMGREAEVDTLVSWLSDKTYGTIVLHGMPGIGKTAVAGAALRMLSKHRRFSKGIALVDCSGLKEPASVLQIVISRFDPGRRAAATTADLRELEGILHQLDGDNRGLVILGNVLPDLPLRDILTPLRMAAFTCLIMADRAPFGAADPRDAELQLEGLEREIAVELFAKEFGKKSMHDLASTHKMGYESVERAVKRIVDAVACHPMAVRVAASLARSQRSLDVVARDLELGPDKSSHEALDPVLSARIDANAVRLVELLQRGVDQLPETAWELLQALSILRGWDVGRQAVIAVGQALDLENVSADVIDIVRHGFGAWLPTNTRLPREADSARIWIHPLVRAIAEKHFIQEWTPEQQQRVYLALSDHYANYATQWTKNSQSVLQADRRNIEGILDLPELDDMPLPLVAICSAMADFWLDRWHLEPAERYLSRAVYAAKRVAQEARQEADRELMGRHLTGLMVAYARVQRRNGHPDTARSILETCLALLRAQGDRRSEADVLHTLAHLERARGQLDAAEQYCKESLALAQGEGDRRLVGLVYAQLGRIARLRGNMPGAIVHFRESLEIFQLTLDSVNEAVAWGYLGRIARTRGDLEEAERCFGKSESLAQERGNKRSLGIIASQRGRIARTLGKLDQAKLHFQRAHDLALESRDTESEGIALGYLGRIARSEGDLDRAEEYFRKSLRVATSIQDRLTESVALQHLGKVARDRAQREEETRSARGTRWDRLMMDAKEYLDRSLALATEVGDRRGQGIIMSHLGTLGVMHGDFERARQQFEQAIAIAQEVEDLRSAIHSEQRLGNLLEAQGAFDEAQRKYHAARNKALSGGYTLDIEQLDQDLEHIQSRKSGGRQRNPVCRL